MKTTTLKHTLYSIVSAALVMGGFSAHAASQIWTNAPANQYWTNTANWVGSAYPGSINGGFNGPNTNNNVDADFATFNTPIPVSGIGGAALPITTADTVIPNERGLEIAGITFDTVNCGAYVFQSDAPITYPGTGILYVCERSDKNGTNGIVMTATVTNSQTFLVPVYIRLPSSTAGQYYFVNNSTTPTATLWFNSITNDSANTRGTVFTLDGSNTGTNTIQYLSKGATTSGAMGFLKQGKGLWIVQNIGGGDFPRQATVNINDGTLKVVDPGCWGASALVTVSSNGVENLINVGQTNTTLNGNGTVWENGSGTLPSIAISSAVGATPHLKTTSPSDVLSIGIPSVSPIAASGGSATSVINIDGPGTVLLNTNSSYDGNWSVNSGSTLQVGATFALGTNSVNANVAAGGTLDATPLGAGVTYNPAATGVGGSGTGTTVGSTAATIKPDAAGILDLATGAKNINLTFTPTGFAGDSGHPALYVSQGALNLGGNLIIINNAANTQLGIGTYVIMTVASGTINNAGNLAAEITGTGLAPNTIGTIQILGGNVELVVNPYTPKILTWQGGNPNATWDVGLTANWLNGGSPSVFNNSDMVTINAIGYTNPIINLSGAIIPGSTIVDTTATNYVFSGTGALTGTANLTKIGAGTLVISNMNNYLGATVVSNGTIQLGKANAISGNSDMTISNGATVDLNTYTASIGALNGGGTVDTAAGGTPVLTIGNNADSGTFSGTIKNTAGTLTVIKANTGTETLSGANTYSGATTVNAGTLRVVNLNALGSGISALTLNSGTFLDVSTNVLANSINGTGTIENNSTTTTNQLIISGTSTINGAILDGSGGGGLSVLIDGGGTNTIGSGSTYSGGTILASNATLFIAANGEAGTGGITASNNSTLRMSSTSSTSTFPGNTITTVGNAAVTFSSGEQGNIWEGQFVGGITSTDIFTGGDNTVAATLGFSNFLGTVIVTNGTVRGYPASGTGPLGGNNTAFVFVGLGAWFNRDGGDVNVFGALSGDYTASINGPGGSSASATTPDVYIIGAANLNSAYSGAITGTNNVVKTGTGTLTFNGANVLATNVVTVGVLISTNIGYGEISMTYVGSTTISNGTLAIQSTMGLTNSTPITLASPTAVLDANSLGTIEDLSSTPLPDGETNAVITNSIFEVISGQTLAGLGTLNGNLQLDSGAIFNVGLSTGTFNVTSNANLSGAVTMNLDDTNTPSTNSTLAAQTFTINPSATLVVTNVGPGLFNGSTFQLFNHGVTFSGSVTLPATDPTGATNYVWANNLTSSGSITLTTGGLPPPPPTPPPITFSFSGGTLTMSWPSAYLGYTLQVQTNSLAVGVTPNWVNVPNSTTVTSMNIVINPQNGAVFYRLHQ